MEIKGGGLDWNTVGIPTALAILASFSVLGIAAVIAKTSQTDRKTRALMLCGIASAMGVCDMGGACGRDAAVCKRRRTGCDER